MYKCVKCGSTVEDLSGVIRCPVCASKILMKERPLIVKKINAR